MISNNDLWQIKYDNAPSNPISIKSIDVFKMYVVVFHVDNLAVKVVIPIFFTTALNRLPCFLFIGKGEKSNKS